MGDRSEVMSPAPQTNSVLESEDGRKLLGRGPHVAEESSLQSALTQAHSPGEFLDADGCLGLFEARNGSRDNWVQLRVVNMLKQKALGNVESLAVIFRRRQL